MESHILKVKEVTHVTHNVLRIVTEKPPQYSFKPGQATEVSINKPGWEDKKRPFTFTSLPTDDYLEFTIKAYSSHDGMTNELLQLKKGDELNVGGVFVAINYHGKGVFIAGGAGVTPFISILRDLQSQKKIAGNTLIFANNKAEDIINKDEFERLLGDKFINILSQEENSKYANGLITEEFLKCKVADLDQYFYLCAPRPMIKAVEGYLINLNVDPSHIVKEKFG